MTTSTPSTARPSAGAALLILLPALLLAALCAVSIDHRPLWRDEMATRQFALLPVGDLFHAVTHVDLVLAPYYLFIHLPAMVAPGPTGLRLASSVAGVIAVACVSYAAWLRWGGVAAFVAGTALAANSDFIATSTQARPYALAIMCLAGAAAVATAIGAGFRAKLSVPVVAVLLIVAVLMQPFSVLAVPCFIGMLWGPQLRRSVIPALLPALVVGGGMLLVAHAQAAQVSWITTPTGRSAVKQMARQAGYEHWWILAVVLIVGILAQLLSRRVDPVWVGWLLLLVGPTVVLYLTSRYVTPIFVPRYVTSFMPAAAVLTGAAAGMVVRRIAALPVRAVVAVIAAALVVAGMATYTRAQVDSRAGLDRSSSYFAALGKYVHPGDTIIFHQSPAAGGQLYGEAYYGGDRRMEQDLLADLPSGRDRTLVRRTVVSVQPLRTREGRAANTGVVWIVGGTSSDAKIPACRAPAPARFVDGAKLVKLVCSG